MYGKIFSSMYDGTLHGKWQAIVTFQQLIVLCGPDGVVDMMPSALSARTSIPLEIITEGLAILEGPDPYSRSKAEEGRRIVLIDPSRPWGWRIVNHEYYRSLVAAEDKRKADRERVAAKRDHDRSQDVAVCRSLSRVVANVAHTDTDTDTDTDTNQEKDNAREGAAPDGVTRTGQEPEPYIRERVDRIKRKHPSCARPDWIAGEKALRNARLKGATWDELEAGAERFAIFCEKTGRIPTPAGKFYAADDKPWLLPWDIPPPTPSRFAKPEKPAYRRPKTVAELEAEEAQCNRATA